MIKFDTVFNHRTFHGALMSKTGARRSVVQKSVVSDSFQKAVVTACEEDPLFFLNTFGYTYDPRKFNPSREFLLYPHQEELAKKILSANGSHDLRIIHSADMGVSWLNTGLALWMWLFRPRTSTLFVTHNESYLTHPSPRSLFWRLSYMHDRLPSWLRANGEYEGIDWQNENGSLISGDTSFGLCCRGDRRTAVFIENAWSIRNLDTVLKITRDLTNSRIASGRASGACSTDLSSWKSVRLHWSRHPNKSAGLYTTGPNGELQILDPVGYSPSYSPVLDGRLRSKWYDHECLACRDPVAIAQEVDMSS